MTDFLKKIIQLLFLAFAFINANPVSAASGIEVSPAIFDETGEIRQLIERKVKVKNNTDHTAQIYAVVRSVGDKQDELINWFEISRGVISLAPGKEQEVPIKVIVSPFAKAGQYHVQVSFVDSTDRWAAEAKAASELQANFIFNLSLEDKKVEKIDEMFFKTVRLINVRDAVRFQYKLKNIGTQDEQIAGKILIYNRKGEEVQSLLINEEKKPLTKNVETVLENKWPIANQMGKYKAKLDLSYGENSNRTLNDTIYFWVIPRFILIGMATAVSFLLLLILYLFIKVSKVRVAVHHHRGHIINLRKNN